MVSAHYDHLGKESDTQIYNGADDNASGTSSILEVAQAFQIAKDKGMSPRRSILFLHVTGEELGLYCSKYYSENPLFPLENTIVNLNSDMVGRVDKNHNKNKNKNYIYLIGTKMLSTELHDLSEKVNKETVQLQLDYTYNDKDDPNRFYYRSDHYNFAKHYIPVIFYFNGVHEDYHEITDTPDKIDYDILSKRAKLIFYTAWEIAHRDKAIDIDEIHKADRDKTRKK